MEEWKSLEAAVARGDWKAGALAESMLQTWRSVKELVPLFAGGEAETLDADFERLCSLLAMRPVDEMALHDVMRRLKVLAEASVPPR